MSTRAARRAAHVLVATAAALVCSAPVAAESLDAAWQRGNAALLAGDARTAARVYAALLDAGVTDGAVWFNLGVAEARRDRLGRAAHAFERALAVRPQLDAAETALRQVRARLAEREVTRSGGAAPSSSAARRALLRPVTEAHAAWALITLHALAWAVWLAGRLAPGRLVTFSRIALPPLMAGTLLAGALLVEKRDGWRAGTAAIVLDDAVPLVPGREQAGAPVEPLREGADVRVLRRSGASVEIATEDGRRGWVPGAALGPL